MSQRSSCIVAGVLSVLGISAVCRGQSETAFTYQGDLRTGGTPAAGLHDLRFRLYRSEGTQIGPTLCADNVSVTDGRFSALLDFGPGMFGTGRLLEIEVRADTGLDCTNAAGFVVLGPRQAITPAPNAMYATAAGTADLATTASDATQLNGQSAAFYQNAANLTGGTLPGSRLSGVYSLPLTLSNAGNSFSGSGSGLTNLNADLLDGLNSTAFLQAVPVPLTLTGTSNTWLIQGENAATGAGAASIRGMATGPTGGTYGGYFENASTAGTAVLGLSERSNGQRLRGEGPVQQ